VSASPRPIPVLRWRAAAEADLPWLVSLRNDPDTARFSRRGALRLEQMRVDLFSKPSRRARIAQSGGQDVGYVVIDEAEGEAEISVVVAPASRGLGFGVALIDSATELCLGTDGLRCVHAFIEASNTASLRAFEAAGYVEERGADARAEGLRAYRRSR